jgi:CspA family cold shock protein
MLGFLSQRFFLFFRPGAPESSVRQRVFCVVFWVAWNGPMMRSKAVGQPAETITKEDIMPTGTVKWFNTTKGYGFIAPDEGGKDVFVHISAVERAGMTGLADNQKVSYELIEGRDGRQSAGELQAL